MPRKLSLRLSLLAAASVVALAVAPTPARAFCGFYVAGADSKLSADTTTVVLMRDGKRTILSMRNDYQGPPEAFAMVVPVPVVLHEGDVKILRNELFERVEALTAPRLVEYWERDPCGGAGTGERGRTRSTTEHDRGSGASSGAAESTQKVEIEAQFAVGEYEIVILSATESKGLDTWLRENGYNIPAGAEPLLRPYVESGSKFFVAKVDPSKVKFAGNGKALLSPLRFHYDSDEFSLPIRLGLINAPDAAPDANGGGSSGKQDLLVHILSPQTRYQVANYPNVTIPTNLDLSESAKDHFGEFYASLFEHTLAEAPGAVVTEYAWSADSCDPCPGPDAALSNKELLELGVDVLPEWAEVASARPFPIARVRMVKTVATKGLPPEIPRRVLERRIKRIEVCYQRGLKRNPELSGAVALSYTIDPIGEVSGVKIDKSALNDAEVDACIEKEVDRLRFSSTEGGVAVTVKQTLDLSPGPMVQVATAASSFVLTRLHARYDASSLGEDLVFEAAGAITGGREFYANGELEQGANESMFENNFQGRYAIRHEWTGKIDCETPTRGTWDGRPRGESEPIIARRRDKAASTGVRLDNFVTAGASTRLGVVALTSPPSAEAPETTPNVADPETETEAVATAPTAEAQPASTCACTAGTEPEAPRGALATLGLVGLGLARVRRRR